MPISLAIHGGAGAIPRDLSPERQQHAHAGLDAALQAGLAVLTADGTAVDAVCAAVTILESDPFFNAGIGSVLDSAGRCTLDAAIMDGKDGRCGAVAGMTHRPHPIQVAHALLDEQAIMLSGTGAERFADARELARIDPDLLITEHRRHQWHAAHTGHQIHLDHDSSDDGARGTVGAVACDHLGHLAAATSTGGMTNKPLGRVSDSALIGAGTWADDQTCAISCTGHGEAFIRRAVAHDIHARIQYSGTVLAAACHQALEGLPDAAGGLIAIDRQGTIAMPFTTAGMYRASAKADGRRAVAIW